MELADELLPLSAPPEARMQLGVLPLGEGSQLTQQGLDLTTLLLDLLQLLHLARIAALLDVEHPELTQLVEHSLVVPMEDEEGVFTHWLYHSSSSSFCLRFSILVRMIFCEAFERLSSSSMKRLILRMAS